MIAKRQYVHLSKCFDTEQENIVLKNDVSRRVADVLNKLKKRGIHSSISLNAAGLTYTGVGDTACCHSCGLEVSEWTTDMDPFTIHIQRSRNCSFVESVLSKNRIRLSSSNNLPTNERNYNLSHCDENPAKRQKIDSQRVSLLSEVETLKKVRYRTFSHWPQNIAPSRTQMILAGFFSCNVRDRVICLYCNLICQQWTSDTDDPQEVHETLSPQCPYVLFILKTRARLSTSTLNENTNNSAATADLSRFREIMQTSPCHSVYMEISKRQASFHSWPQESLPSVDDLVRAGFFYTGSNTIVTCFYCDGSLQNWDPKDNPLIEHLRWFPFCAYAKQLCDDELYRKIQKLKRTSQG
ncbi:unnamed protein product [Rotaria sp. Silwood1]|nr:unnamed protein product [Rotaria sp. Silwood1]CAF3527890.1 unnamed protein product [Rotaria sp. Silwood1]CAF4599611.1 unnamed protein product [Rotaria sp. Silwood1]CAF4963593.1 unnamed protein product [Rotaria sp. Silwood1]